MTYDAIVIGGGIIGLSTAYHLVCAGARTLLFDRKDPGRATDAGAGIIAPETNSNESETWVDFGIRAGAYYPDFIRTLETEQDGDTGYAVCGQLKIAVSEDEIDPFETAKKRIFDRRDRRGTPSPEDLFEISSEDAQKQFPPLAPTRGALFYRHAARVDGRSSHKRWKKPPQPGIWISNGKALTA